MFKNSTHRMAGHAAAAQSPNTPAHLRQHQARLAKGGTTMPKVQSKGLRLPKMSTSNTTVARGGVPQAQTVGGFEPVEQRDPEDQDVFQQDNNMAMDQPGSIRSAPAASGSRPKTISPKLPRQGSSGMRVAGLKTVGQRGPGIQKKVTPKNLRNVQPGGPKKYGGGALYGF